MHLFTWLLLLPCATAFAIPASYTWARGGDSQPGGRAHSAPARSRVSMGDLDAQQFGRTQLDDEELNLSFSDDKLQAVVKVYAVHCSPDYFNPWQNKAPETSSGSSFAVKHDGKLKLVTNAHVVEDCSYVQVRKTGDAKKYEAQLLVVAHECDLATLHVEDPDFWEGVIPLELGGVPRLQDAVTLLGYPQGGEGMSITQGVVSRIEVGRYAHSGHSLLSMQIDAAVNPGNSGGPCLDSEGFVVGVAFQNQCDSQNIGYVIPVPIVQHFLQDVDPVTKRYRGYCSVGVTYQMMENIQLRSSLGMTEEMTGVLVRAIHPLAKCKDQVQPNDVLLAIDGVDIANDGSIAIGQQERITFHHLIHMKYAGETGILRLLRHGEVMEVEVEVVPLPLLIPSNGEVDKVPSYLIHAGLVFVPLTKPYLMEYGEDWYNDAPRNLVDVTLTKTIQQADEQVIILNNVLAGPETSGYEQMINKRLLSVNGQKVHNLKALHQKLQEVPSDCKYITFELDVMTGAPGLLVLEHATAEAVTQQLMQTYRIPAAMSPDLSCDQGKIS